MTPGEAWMNARWDHQRKAIFRALRIAPDESCASYAITPFRIMRDDRGIACIGGAVGVWRSLAPKGWTEDRITDVILWDPKGGTVSLVGSDDAAIVMPYDCEPRITVYADGFAFFRAWADNRAATFERLRLAKQHRSLTAAEPLDGGLPGILVVGELLKLPWHSLGASVLVAGPGINAKALNTAVIRSARLPRVEAA